MEWKKIWSLKVQGEVKNLLWRACITSIPSKQNLLRRKVILEDVCDHCHRSSEDTLHALWSSPCLSPIWDSDSMWNIRSSTSFSRFGDLVAFVIERGKNIDLFVVLVWTIWYRRNLLHASDKSSPLVRCCLLQ